MTERADAQAKVLRFLGSPEAYGGGATTVERMETHASIVFLAGDRAYKVKRAVKYPFLDFSSLEKRYAACRNELKVNARTAPELYLRIAPVLALRRGGFRLGAEGEEGDGGGGGEVVEWVLVMRRFDQHGLFDRMAEEGRLPLLLMAPLAEEIASFHASADRHLAQDVPVAALAAILDDNAAELAGARDAFAPELASALAETAREMLSALTPLIKARARDGYVRHCHGDLHLRNIVLAENRPVLFDAIEFDDRLAIIDVLYDLAFLLMDLGKRGLHAHANAVLNAYLDAEGSTGNLVGLALLPLYLSTRAAIRAKVEALRAAKLEGEAADAALSEARAYFDLARRFLIGSRPHLVVIGGLSGSGKSAVSRAIAAAFAEMPLDSAEKPKIGAEIPLDCAELRMDRGGFPGAVHVRSDRERKRMFGVGAGERLPKNAYASEVSGLVYAACRKRAGLALGAGCSVVLDGVHARPEERAAARQVAEKLGVSFTGIWLDADPSVLKSRVSARKGDISDATPEVVEEQLGYDLGAMDFARVDATKSLENVVKSCLAIIARDASER